MSEDAPPEASVQYGDLEGTAAADWHSGIDEFEKLAESIGIDTSRYEPITLDFSGVPPEYFSIYAIDKEITGEGIWEYIKENNGKAPVVRFHFDKSLDDLQPYLKRLKVVLTSRLFSGVSAFEEINDVWMEEE